MPSYQKTPVQTYSRAAEKVGERMAKPGKNPDLVREMVSAVQSQAGDISDYIIQKSRSSAQSTASRRRG